MILLTVIIIKGFGIILTWLHKPKLMKKLLYTWFLFLALFDTACETNNVSKLKTGVKVIRKCCKELSADDPRSVGLLKEAKGKADPNRNVSSILPSYFWDTKNMIW